MPWLPQQEHSHEALRAPQQGEEDTGSALPVPQVVGPLSDAAVLVSPCQRARVWHIFLVDRDQNNSKLEWVGELWHLGC